MGDLPALSPSSPRILIVMAEQWPRALLRAALREAGYDAIGTRSLDGALAHPAQAPDRGPVGAIVLDAATVDAVPAAVSGAAIAELVGRHGGAPVVLLASAVRADPSGNWARVIRRPFSIEDVVRAVEDLAGPGL
jgi:hypothetical protein